MLTVSKLPRDPFLTHSERLLRHLTRDLDPMAEILEIGCGECSPLVSMTARLWPNARLHQIDASSDVIDAARRNNPRGQVQRMNARQMSSIANGSKDAILAMSVFDQNPATAMPGIADEMRRVLRERGVVVYLHNQEFNAPAASASFVRRSPPQYLLPNDRWEPTNDLEYCSGDAAVVDEAMARLGTQVEALRYYVEFFHQLDAQKRSQEGKLSVPLAGKLTPPLLQGMRAVVGILRQAGVPLTDHSTKQLLSDLVESSLLSDANGFEILTAGLFELQFSSHWAQTFREKPQVDCFVRGINKFGYASDIRPARLPTAKQELNEAPPVGEDEILFVGYQYGAVARKRSQTE